VLKTAFKKDASSGRFKKGVKVGALIG
jgi:hypothetical protein